MKRDTDGILYVLLVNMEGKDLVKIGVTTRRIEDRVSEILVSAFKVYREFFYCKPKRFKKTTNIFSKEKQLHDTFSSFRYTTSKKFGGHTEFFDVPLDDVVAEYDKIVTTSKKKKGVFFTTQR